MTAATVPTPGTAADAEAADLSIQVQQRSRDVAGWIFFGLIASAVVISMLILAILLVDVVADGWEQLSTRLGAFLEGTLRSRSDDAVLGVHQGIYGTLWIGIFVAVIAFPAGIAAALYLEEYASKSRLAALI